MQMLAIDADPFSAEYLEDPFPIQVELRGAGPVVRLTRYGIAAVARYSPVRMVLSDWRAFSAASGVGLSDFRKEKPWRLPSLVLETDPPLHDRTRTVLGRVLSAAAVRPRFQQNADAMVDTLLERGTFDAIHDLAEAYPLQVFPDAVGMARKNASICFPMATWCSTRSVHETLSSRRR